MGLIKIGGIGVGQAIDPSHISNIYKALNGESENDILIKGSLSVENIFNLAGNAFITENLNVKQAISASRLVVREDYARIGNVFIVKNNAVLINGNNTIKNTLQVNENLVVTGSVSLFGLPQDQTSTTFLSIDPKSKVVTYTTGSLRDYQIEKFRFDNHEDLEDATSFRGKIHNISFYQTSNLENFYVSSRLDNNPTWTKHYNLNEFQNWINENVEGEEIKGIIFWVKINVKYKDFLSGKTEVILRYSN